MDVDEDEEDGTQMPKAVQDYGIEVNFEDVDDEEREVCFLSCSGATANRRLRTDLPKH